jgi:peptidoglycan/LPS O-acetylase OafA/YrhL
MNESSIKKYDYIDALRGFAILGVVLVHSIQWIPPRSDYISEFASQGARGVQLFYVASAFTIFLSIEARKKQETRALVNFFIRRFFRIAPLFYSAIIIYILYDGMGARYWAPNGISWWYIPMTASFLHGWHPEVVNAVVPGGWSIAVEMTFYLLVPYLFLKLNNIKSTLAILFGSLVLAKISSTIVVTMLQPYYPASQQYLVDSFSYFSFFSQLPIFMLGILLYHIVKKYPDQDKTIGLLFLFVSIFLFTAFLRTKTFGDLLPQHFLISIAFLFFSLSLHFWPHVLLVNRITTLIGKLSFSLYLIHFIVLNIMSSILLKNGFILNGNKGFVLNYLLALILSIGISYVTYNLIEIPGINLGKSIIRKLS